MFISFHTANIALFYYFAIQSTEKFVINCIFFILRPLYLYIIGRRRGRGGLFSTVSGGREQKRAFPAVGSKTGLPPQAVRAVRSCAKTSPSPQAVRVVRSCANMGGTGYGHGFATLRRQRAVGAFLGVMPLFCKFRVGFSMAFFFLFYTKVGIQHRNLYIML